MRLTIAVLVMATITLMAMSVVFDGVLPFSLSFPSVVSDPIIEVASTVTAPVVAESVVQTQTVAKEMAQTGMYASCGAGGHF